MLSTYYCIDGLCSDQGAIEDSCQIGVLCLGDFGKVVNQRSIKEAEFVMHSVEVGTHVIERVFPELRYCR